MRKSGSTVLRGQRKITDTRILKIKKLARWVFQDQALAQQFLDLPNPALADRIPRQVAQTNAGAREVVALLSRFAHGDLA